MNKNKIIPKLRFPEFEKDGEWKVKELGEIGKFVGGGTPSTSIPEYWGGQILWYTPTEIKEGTLNESIRKITDKGLKNSSAKLLPSGTILITTRATIGDAAITEKECSTNQGFQSLIVKESEVNTFWLYWILQHKTELLKRASGSTFKEIGKNEIKSIPVISPEKVEQQKIASCLSSLDEIIAAENEKLELLSEHKKGLMQKLFPKENETTPEFRFPEFKKNGEWEEKKLGEVIEIKGRIGYRGYTLADIVNKGEGAISMSPSNIDQSGTLSFSKSTYITWEKYEESPEIMLQNEFTVLVKTGSTFGKVAYIKNLNEKATINPQLVVLKPTKIDSFFLYLIVSNSSVQEQINATVVGGAIPTLSQDSISKFEILIPKPEEQQKITSVLSSLDEIITAQTERIEQLKEHKKGLMQGLFPKIK